jgi:hypothetical protein
MAAFYSLLCKAIKKQPARRFGRLFWRSGRDSNPRAIARKLISSQPRYDHFDTAANAALQINLFTAQLLYQKGRWQSMLTRGFATVVCQAYARGSTYSKIHR